LNQKVVDLRRRDEPIVTNNGLAPIGPKRSKSLGDAPVLESNVHGASDTNYSITVEQDKFESLAKAKEPSQKSKRPVAEPKRSVKKRSTSSAEKMLVPSPEVRSNASTPSKGKSSSDKVPRRNQATPEDSTAQMEKEVQRELKKEIQRSARNSRKVTPGASPDVPKKPSPEELAKGASTTRRRPASKSSSPKYTTPYLRIQIFEL